MTLKQKALAVEKLPDASFDMKTEARSILAKIAAEEARHAQAMDNLAEHFALTTWNTVEKNWTAREIEKARFEALK